MAKEVKIPAIAKVREMDPVHVKFKSLKELQSEKPVKTSKAKFLKEKILKEV